ncbi:MAG: LysR family transcriptional regulator [Eubacterium sp.]|nr:LysR family transcriptional regulator [Eubacterium sp.]
MIEIYLLEQLCAFKEYGTLSEAAEHLNIAQPSVSRAMKKLEEQLGVSLFERQKNKIVLNQTGLLAAEYARRILDEEKNMEAQIKAFDRRLHTVNVGSIAPGPLMVLLPRLTALFADQVVSSDIETEEALLQKLNHNDYRFIILNRPLDDEKYICKEYMTEQLYISVNHFHPIATQKSVTFAEADGQNFIMYSQVGFWESIVKEQMPSSNFYKQENLEAVGEIAANSNLPSFSTDITQKILPSRRNGRINVPFSDPAAKATYYLIYKKENAQLCARLLA